MRSETIIFFIIYIFANTTISPAADPGSLRGKVIEKAKDGTLIPVAGAVVYWSNSTGGASTDSTGGFTLSYNNADTRLIVKMVGFRTDTVTVSGPGTIDIILVPEAHETEGVVVSSDRAALFADYLEARNKLVITEKELCKAPCCNLSESFESNPSVDVSFSEAITGARQIEMLGLSGKYTQMTIENLPAARGISSSAGMAYIPGSWVKSINLVKGVSSVVYGYESISGHIDVELHSPDADEPENTRLNIYSDYDRRLEANLGYRTRLSDNLSVITLAHLSGKRYAKDNNSDLFMDSPDFYTNNILQKWSYTTESGINAQLGLQFLNDQKTGGTLGQGQPPYKYSSDNSQYMICGKAGFAPPEESHNSFGALWSYQRNINDSRFGLKNYTGTGETGYINLIHQYISESEIHKLRSGISFLFRKDEEEYLTSKFSGIESIPGIFAEYSYLPSDEFSVIAGIRGDFHNHYGELLSPRIHIRYLPREDLVFKVGLGKGFHSANIFSENAPILASSRRLLLSNGSEFGYGLSLEEGWNYGINSTFYFDYDSRPGTFAVDLYSTKFISAVISDLDSSPQEITISSVKSGAYSHSIQSELNFSPAPKLDLRLAYRYINARQLINGKWNERPLTAGNRALLNFSYSGTGIGDVTEKTILDVTVNWSGQKRLPVSGYSPSFTVVNTQVTAEFSPGLALFIGVENVFDYTQRGLIIDPQNPFGSNFDASVVWGPVSGRTAFAGLRLNY